MSSASFLNQAQASEQRGLTYSSGMANGDVRRPSSSAPLPRVSVVIPAFNSCAFIEATIASVLRQDFDSFEIVIVDDGSTDETPDVVRAMEVQHPGRIRLVEQSNSGSAVARNRGVREARGELIAFIDADDLWFPEKLGAQVRYLDANPDVGIVYCGWAELLPGDTPDLDRAESANASPHEIDPDASGWLYTTLLDDCVVWTSTVVARRALLERVGGFDPDLRRGQDYDYWLRASRETRIDKLARIMALYRIHRQSITHQLHARNFQYEVLVKNLARWGRDSAYCRRMPWTRLRRRLSSTWHYYGAVQLNFGEHVDAIGSALRSLAFWPMSVPGWKLLAKAGFGYIRRLLGMPQV